MRFHFATALIAGAVLGQVGASPLRVVIVSSTQEVSTEPNRDVPFGHAVPSALVTLAKPAGSDGKIRRPCKARLREKTLEISNAFRKAFGLPLIQTIAPVKPTTKDAATNTEGNYRILPFVGTPPAIIEVQGGHRPHRHHAGGFRHRMANASFMERLHFSLTALGPWEGRAVAFVLGCGIGVLLRMLWVLTVVTYRMFKGNKDGEHKYTEIIVVEEYEDSNESVPAPPTYTYVDEKADGKVAAPDTLEQTK